jgi:hypothetical protein
VAGETRLPLESMRPRALFLPEVNQMLSEESMANRLRSLERVLVTASGYWAMVLGRVRR